MTSKANHMNRRYSSMSKKEMLSITELRKMHGKPVFVQFGYEPEGVWAICDIYKDTFTFYSLLGETNPDADLYNLEYNDPDGYHGLHVLGWRAFASEPAAEATTNMEEAT